jgi:hypothetical protein
MKPSIGLVAIGLFVAVTCAQTFVQAVTARPDRRGIVG